MVGCSISGCKSRSERKDDVITFHSFPKNPILRKQWTKATGRTNWKPSKYAKICSLHFNETDIVFRNKIRRMNRTAIPKRRQLSRTRTLCSVKAAMNASVDEQSEGTPAEKSQFSPKIATVTSVTVTNMEPYPMAVTETRTEPYDEEITNTPPEDVECRSCLQRFDYEAGLIDMFQAWEPPWNGMSVTIAEDLAQIANIEITQEDSYSKLICQFCHQKLLDACSFVVNVRINDRLLRQRAEMLTEQEDSWPKPIQIDRNVNSDVYNTAMDVEIKQEVLSDDETYTNRPEETFKEGADATDETENVYNDLEIKIEPEEIIRPPPYQITVNGTITDDQYEQNSIHINGNHQPLVEGGSVVLINRRKKFRDERLAKRAKLLEKEALKSRLEDFLQFHDKEEGDEVEGVEIIDSDDSDTVDLNDNDTVKISDNGHNNYTPQIYVIPENVETVSTIYPPDEVPTKLSDFRIRRDSQTQPVVQDIPNINVPEELTYEHKSVIVDAKSYLFNEQLAEIPTAMFEDREVPSDDTSKLDSDAIPLSTFLQDFSSNPDVEKKYDVDGRQMKSPCSCPRRCFERVSHEQRVKIFHHFWKICETWDERYEFVLNNVKLIEHKTDTKTQMFYIYRLVTDSQAEKVCKVMFLNTLSIGNNFIRRSFSNADKYSNEPCLKKKRISILNPFEYSESVISHIQTYSVTVNEPNKIDLTFLEAGLDVAEMYEQYRKWMVKCNNPPNMIATEAIYRKIFDTKFNLKYTSPRETKCDYCESYKIKIQHATDKEEKQIIENAKNLHDKEVEKRNLRKVRDQRESKRNKRKKVLFFGMQQETVKVEGEKRELWSAGVTVLDASTNFATHFMWTQETGGRGANEVASCVIRWVNENVEYLATVTHLTLWSEDYAQGLNPTLVLAYIWLLKKYTHLQVITHKFTIKGHTHKELKKLHLKICDTKKYLDEMQLLMPTDQPLSVKTPVGDGVFWIRDMQRHHFKDINCLERPRGPYFLMSKNLYREDFDISNCVWLQVRQNDLATLFYKNSFSEKFNAVAYNIDETKQLPLDLPALSMDD